jgi:hypothetical protein
MRQWLMGVVTGAFIGGLLVTRSASVAEAA